MLPPMDFLLAAEILADVLTYIPSEKDCCMKSGLAAATNTGRLLVASVGGTAGCRTCKWTFGLPGPFQP
jgi:hypothetical protein